MRITMNTALKFVTLTCSLRAVHLMPAIAAALPELGPEGVTFEAVRDRQVHSPHYSQDTEAAGFPT
jgi:chromate reductase